ncbi:hypothetical protein M514_18357 [Trichuris suis]|uniref:DUF4371 domain-containing protein n=1 Tax=Trichuris suis TaxID=68888 RepID=A0A085NJ39_9BILA|nr:hypothetical protein M514_18357 [Trichuris suis]
MDSPKKKTRQYSTEYLKFGFSCSPANRRLLMCLICEKVFSNEAMKPSRLKEHFTRCHPDKRCKDMAYFFSFFKGEDLQSPHIAEIALMIAKSSKPHNIGEDLILPATAEILETVLHQPARTIVSKTPLSRRTVQRRIDAVAQDIEATLYGILKNTEFALQLDESTLPGNEAVLLAYVRFIKQEHLVQELLFAKELLTDTKGASIFEVVNDFFKEKQIPFKNILAVAIDGAPSMRCLRSTPAAPSRKTPERPLEQFTSVCDPGDLYCKFNEMNKQLQSNELNLIKTKAVISAFLSKLMLFKCSFARGEFCQFPTLAKVSKEVKILENDVYIYCHHFEMLQEDFLRRFHDILSLVIPNWVLDPFIVNPLNVDIHLQEELIDLQSNEEIKPRMERGLAAPRNSTALSCPVGSDEECCYGSRHEEAESPRSSQSGRFTTAGHVNETQY